MSLSKLLPTLDNAGRRLVLSEILGEPVALRMIRLRQVKGAQSGEASDPINNKNSKRLKETWVESNRKVQGPSVITPDVLTQESEISSGDDQEGGDENE